MNKLSFQENQRDFFEYMPDSLQRSNKQFWFDIFIIVLFSPFIIAIKLFTFFHA